MSKRIHELADGPGTAGKWCSVDRGTRGWCNVTRHVYHYETEMLTFVVGEDGNWNGDVSTVVANIGHGSVSDQNGMNKLFARQAMPFAYYREQAGCGPRIEVLHDGPMYRYGITREDLYRARFAEVTLDHALRHWGFRYVQT